MSAPVPSHVTAGPPAVHYRARAALPLGGPPVLTASATMPEAEALYTHTCISKKLLEKKSHARPPLNDTTLSASGLNSTLGGRSEASEAGAGWCAEHEGERLDFYCTPCRQVVCAYCLLVGRHTNHPNVPVAEAGRVARAALLQQLHGVDEQTSGLGRTVEECGARARHVQRVFEAHAEEIRTQIGALQASLGRLEARRARQQRAVCARLEEARDAAEALLATCGQPLQSHDAVLGIDTATLHRISAEHATLVPLLRRELAGRAEAVQRVLARAAATHESVRRWLADAPADGAAGPDRPKARAGGRSSRKTGRHRAHARPVAVSFGAESGRASPAAEAAGLRGAHSADTSATWTDEPGDDDWGAGPHRRDDARALPPADGLVSGACQPLGPPLTQTPGVDGVVEALVHALRTESREVCAAATGHVRAAAAAAVQDETYVPLVPHAAGAGADGAGDVAAALSRSCDSAASDAAGAPVPGGLGDDPVLAQYYAQEKENVHRRVRDVLESLDSGPDPPALPAAVHSFTQLRAGLRGALILQDRALTCSVVQGLRRLRDRHGDVAALLEAEETALLNLLP